MEMLIGGIVRVVVRMAIFYFKAIWRLFRWSVLRGPSSMWKWVRTRVMAEAPVWRAFLLSCLPWVVTVLVLVVPYAVAARPGAGVLPETARWWTTRVSSWQLSASTWVDGQPVAWMKSGSTPAMFFVMFGWPWVRVLAPLSFASLVFGGPFWVLVHRNARRAVENAGAGPTSGDPGAEP
jgi:hypothetical protein